MQYWWFWLIVTYLSGSIPFGLLLGRAQGIDIRQHGSGNIGATNVGRVLGKKWGGLCFILDVLKGTVPTFLAGHFLGYAGQTQLPHADAYTWMFIGSMAMLGHIFPVWLRFKGGKGVATGLGILLGFWPLLTLPGLAGGLTWILFAACFRYVSLASIFASALIPAYLWLGSMLRHHAVADIQPFFIITSILCLLLIVKHHSNIRRLYAGTEPKLGAGTPKAP